jgi:hypothetical protein
MGKKSRMSVLKRKRELKKAEKAAVKREKREQREPRDSTEPQIASREELEGYGFAHPEDESRK